MSLSHPTPSAASRVHPPAKTESRQNSFFSCSERRSWLQSSVPLSVRCLGTAVRSPTVKSFRESSSFSEICSTESAPTLAAASSMASGSPSSLRHISATARMFSDPIVKVGSRCRTRSAKSRADSERSISPTVGERRGSGTESAGTGHLDSPATLRASRLVARTRKRGQESSNTPIPATPRLLRGARSCPKRAASPWRARPPRARR